MLSEQGDTVRASAGITQSLRARNPSVQIANSIYDSDTTSIAAPSELEFEFDEVVINSQAYRRAMAHAQARARPLDSHADPVTVDDVLTRPRLSLSEKMTERSKQHQSRRRGSKT
jgi:hypothetical protein